MLKPGQVLFTYLHLAPDPEQARDLVASGAVCIAYETVTSATGGLPLLAPMSEVAGRMSIQAGAYFLEKAHGGLGVLLGGVPGVDPAKVRDPRRRRGRLARLPHRARHGRGSLGARPQHRRAARAVAAVRAAAQHRVLDPRCDRAPRHERRSGRSAACSIPGASAPKLVSAALVKQMKKGSVIVDVAIDQGGCFETSHPTTHAEPTYVVDGVIHYCVANMPGGVPRTSTFALNNATLPFVLALADKGYRARARRRRAPAQRPQRRVRQGDLRAGRRGARLRLRRHHVGAAVT